MWLLVISIYLSIKLLRLSCQISSVNGMFLNLLGTFEKHEYSVLVECMILHILDEFVNYTV
jgi:hypothetical protein